MYLKDKLIEISIDDEKSIPWIVRLIENPSSRFSLPGRINLYNHDCLHAVLDQDTSSLGEAFVVGFCMGSDPDTNWWHLLIFRFFSQYLYPQNYKMSPADLISFREGFDYGKFLEYEKLNCLDFKQFYHYYLPTLRTFLGVNINTINLLKKEIEEEIYWQKFRMRSKDKLAERLKYSSSIFAVIGGFLLALKIQISGYGFIFLACSSSQLLISSWLKKDLSLIVYAGSVFFFVDSLGIYRWLIK